MIGPARDDGRARLPRPRRAAWWPGPAALALLGAIAVAGCGSGYPAGDAAAGPSGSGPAQSPAGSASVSASPGATVSRGSNSMNKGSATQPAPAATGSSPGQEPGCSRWPAGSTSTILLISQPGNGQQYCVQPGQAVQVSLSGVLSPRAGSEPPRLTGTGLVPSPAGQAHLIRSPAAAYQAVRPGRAVLTIVRLPCHSVEPAQTPATGSGGASSLGGPGPAASANAVELAYRGGAPVGAQCAIVQALRVTVVVR
jgi:hypothetical protein